MFKFLTFACDAHPFRVRFGALVLLAAAGCAEVEGRDDGFELRTDSLGVIHATNRGEGAWTDDERWRIGEPTFRVGSLDGAEEVTFGRISDVAVGPDGRIYVLDFQAQDIRVFGSDGEFLFRFGRPGEGPGEFSWPDGLEFTQDGSIAVRDARLFRITLFSPDGVYLRDFRIQRPYPQTDAHSANYFWITNDDVIVDRVSISIGIASADSLALARYSTAGAALDTLIVAETRSAIVTVTRNGLAMAGLSIPFSPRPIVAVGPDGRIARALGDTYRIEVLDQNGRVERVITREVETVTVTAAERDSLTVAMRESAREMAEGGTLEEFEFPTTKPAITHVFADAAGNWWVGAQREPNRFAPPTPHPRSFDVFDAEGRFLGSVETPFRILEIGNDYVAGVADNELGVSFAVVAPLTKGPARDGTR